MRDPRLDELIQMETWDWWKAQVFYLRERKDYAGAEALFLEFKLTHPESKSWGLIDLVGIMKVKI